MIEKSGMSEDEREDIQPEGNATGQQEQLWWGQGQQGRGGSRNSMAGVMGMVVVGALAATAVAHAAAAVARAAAGAGVLCAPFPSFFLSSFPFFIFIFSSISNVYTLF